MKIIRKIKNDKNKINFVRINILDWNFMIKKAENALFRSGGNFNHILLYGYILLFGLILKYNRIYRV